MRDEGKESRPPQLAIRVFENCLETLTVAAFGASSKVVPKYISCVDLAARWVGADGTASFLAYPRAVFSNFAITLTTGRLLIVTTIDALRGQQSLGSGSLKQLEAACAAWFKLPNTGGIMIGHFWLTNEHIKLP